MKEKKSVKLVLLLRDNVPGVKGTVSLSSPFSWPSYLSATRRTGFPLATAREFDRLPVPSKN